MNKSNRVHAWIQEFLSGWGGGGSRPDGQKTVWTMVFFSHQLILQFKEWIQWFYYRGEEGSNFFQEVGVSKETDITCDFQGGGGRTPYPLPLWIRTWGRLTPLFAYRIMVYQNLNKTEKYNPKTTKWKKLSPAGRDSKCGSRGGSGGPDPPGKSQVIWVSIGYKQFDPPGKSWDPPLLENVGPPLEP